MTLILNNEDYMADFYISPHGNDSFSGTLPVVSDDGKDGPLLTLEESKKRVREINEGNIKVLIREGDYFMNETVVFSMEDSGHKNRVIRYEAYPNETPVLTSGINITNWKKVYDYPIGLPKEAENNIWQAAIPEELTTVLTMYDKDIQLTRAHGEFFEPTQLIEYDKTVTSNVSHENDRALLRRIDFPKGVMRSWDNIEDIEIRIMPVPWTCNLLPLESVDVENNVAWLAVEATAPAWAKSKGIRVENAIDYLNQPRRWCVDTKKGVIYYWPEDDEPSENIYVPSLKEFIKVSGNIDYEGSTDQPVTHLHFKGLSFKYGMRDRTDKGYKGWGIQHDWEMFDKDTAVFRFRGAKECSITECHFYATSGTALRLDLFCQNILIENNLFDNIGAMGVLLCGYGPGTKDVNCHNIIKNNIITRCGEVIWHGHAIFVWQSGHNIIQNNKIHHSARKAIGICGIRVAIMENRSHTFDEGAQTVRWSEIDKAIDVKKDVFSRYLPFLHARDNIIKDNEIYRVLEKIGDGSALNISGAGTGNLVKRNYIHHIATHDSSSAFRIDDWQCMTTVEDNIIYMSNVGAITRKNYNTISNNIIVDVNCIGYYRFASYPDEEANFGSIIKNNICYESGPGARFYKAAYLVSEGATYPYHCKADYNLFYCAADKDFALKEINEWQEQGIEKNSICADPLFTDLKKENFTLLPESPAFKLGFKQIDQSKIGITHAYPSHLKKLEYHEKEDMRVYDRGKDTSIENYEWW